MKTYKIDPNQITTYSRRSNSNFLKMLIIVMAGFSALTYFTYINDNTSQNDINIHIISMGITFLMLIANAFNSLKFGRIMAENMIYTIDENTISRSIDMSHETRLNFMHKLSLKQLENSPLYSKFISIQLDNIQSCELKSGNLVIKSKNANSVTGKGIIYIPKEIEHFDELKRRFL